MMKIYINKDFQCFTEKADDRKECECAFFDGKSARFIEGYRYVPSGETWTRKDGVQFAGEMITPLENPIILEIYDNIEKQKDRSTKIVDANNEQLQLLEDCIVEIAGIVYADDTKGQEK